MLPPGMVDSYLGSKEDTKTFLGWLLQQSTSQGYKLPQAVTSAASSRQGTKNFKIPVSEILTQGQKVAAARPTIFAPAHVGRSLGRTIRARQRFTAWYANSPNKDAAADAAHKHFTDVLKQIADRLPLSPQPPTTGNSPSRTVTSSSTIQSVSNYFGKLTVEDLQAAEDGTPATPSQFPIPGAPKIECQPDLGKAADERLFEVYCFIEGMHGLHDHIAAELQKYVDGKCSAEVLHLIVSAAIEILRQRELDLHGRENENPPDRNATMTILGKGRHLEDNLSSRQPRPTDFHYALTYWSLARFRLSTLYNHSGIYPYLFTKLTDKMTEDVELKASWKADHDFLAQYLIDLPLECAIRAPSKSQSFTDALQVSEYNLDGVTTSFTRLIFGKGVQITSSMVLAAEILLDFHALLGNKFEKEDLRLRSLAHGMTHKLLGISRTSEKISHNEMQIAFQLQSSYQWGEHWSVPAHRYLALRNLPAGGKQEDLLGYHTVVWARMNDKDQKEANAAMKLLKKKVPDPKPIFSRIQKYLAANVGPSLDARFLRHANPLICGAHSLEMRVKYEEFGMRFANSYAVLSGMAQLYHALRHICYLNGTWPDMENLIAHHRKEIFFGMLPKEPQKMYSHVRLVSGTHSALISEEQRIQRSGRQPKSLNLRRSGRDKISWDLIPSKICAVLRDYFNGRDESARTLARLHGLAQEEKALSQGRVNHTASSRVVSNVQELKEFADYLQVALDRSFSIDYATLTRTCNALLKRIDEGIKTTLYAQNVRPEWHWKVPSLTGYTTVLNVLADIVVANANTQGVSRPDPPFSRNAREAVVAARILQEYIQAGAVGVSGENTVVGVTEFQRDKMPRRKVNVGGNARSGAQFVYDRNEEHRLVNRETKKDMARRAAAGQLG